mgnify:CR=1 FL=1
MNKIKKVLSATLVAACILSCANQGNVYAACYGEVTGTLREKSVYGKITCSEVAHHLTIVLNYKTMSTLTGAVKKRRARNDTFGNNTMATKRAEAGRHESTTFLNVVGMVDNVTKRNFNVTSYGTTNREYW